MANSILSLTVPDHSFKQKKQKKQKGKKAKQRKADAHVAEIDRLNAAAEIERLSAIVFALIQNNLAMAMALNQFGNARQTQEDAMCVTPALVATAALEERGQNP